MNTLVFGGTRYFGIHLVNKLLSNAYNVTIATRGITPDSFGTNINRKVIERQNADSIRRALYNETYDVVYDNLAYCSNDVRHIFEALHINKYIMTSSCSVYQNWHENMKETQMNTKNYPLKWCNRQDFAYDEIKRQAECALYQKYSDTPSVAVRFPFVFGKDDYTQRLYFYVEHIIKGIPMFVDNIEARLSFINSQEAGNFLAWISCQPVSGYINASSNGTISLDEIISYTEKRSGKKAILKEQSEPAPLNGVPSFSLNTEIAKTAGFKFNEIQNWVYPLIDIWIDTLCTN